MKRAGVGWRLFLVSCVDRAPAWRQRGVRRRNNALHAMTNERRNSIKQEGVLADLSSISDTGLVFHSPEALMTGTEVGMVIQTSLLGSLREWSVQGWVVECQPGESESGKELGFAVTLLFSDLPQGLKQLLGQVSGNRLYAYPPVKGEEFFGLN